MNSKKSVLVVGVGSIGERHVRCFGNTGRAEISICEINPELRKKVAERYSPAHAFASLDDGLNAKPDAVFICAPADLHIPMALRAAAANVNLLIEKPLSINLNGIAELRREVAQRNLVAIVAYTYRYHPVLSAMRDAIRSGRFGEPVECVAVWGQHFPFYRPAYRQIYYRSRATGGGAIQDSITHAVNAAEWLVGPIDALVADAGHQVLDGVEVEDTVHVIARHGNVMGSYSLNQYQAPNESFITVVCTKGTARMEFHNCRWMWATEPGAPWNIEPSKMLERDDLFTAQANGLLDLLEGKAPPRCTLNDGEQTLRTNMATLASVENRAWQKLADL